MEEIAFILKAALVCGAAFFSSPQRLEEKKGTQRFATLIKRKEQ